MLWLLAQLLVLCLTAIYFVDFFTLQNTLFNPYQRAARQFSKIVSGYFDLEETGIHFLERHGVRFERTLGLLFEYLAPDLYPYRRLYLDVLLCRKKSVETEVDRVMDSISRSCHQQFMCAVFQLRVCGELRNPRPVAEFRKSFNEFIHFKKQSDLIKRLMEIGTELRQIETALTCCDPMDADALKLRYDICVDEIQQTLGGRDAEKPFLYNTAYEPKIKAGI